MSEIEATRLDGPFRRARILAGSLLASVLLYGVVGEVFAASHAPFTGFNRFEGWEMLRYVFGAVTIGTVAAGAFVRPRVVSQALAGGQDVAAALTTGTVLASALAEVPAVLGLVLFIVAGSRPDLWAFLGISLILHLLAFPRRDRWEEQARQRR